MKDGHYTTTSFLCRFRCHFVVLLFVTYQKGEPMIVLSRHLAIITIMVVVIAVSSDCGSWLVEWHDGPGPGGEPRPLFPRPAHTSTPTLTATPEATLTPIPQFGHKSGWQDSNLPSYPSQVFTHDYYLKLQFETTLNFKYYCKDNEVYNNQNHCDSNNNVRRFRILADPELKPY